MKKMVFIILLIGCIGYSQQEKEIGFRKNDHFISGSVGFHNTSFPDDSKSTKFNIQPRAGHFINDFVALGLSLGYDTETHKDSDNTKTVDNSTYTIGVFGRYYLLPGNRFSIFGELGVGFGFLKDHMTDNNSNGINASFSPGLSYFISKNFAIEANIGVLSYNSVKPDKKDANATKTFDVGLDFDHINLALIYAF